MKRGTVIVCGIVWWYPLAGVTYQFLHYLLGLQQLGYEVVYVEDSAREVYDLATHCYTYDWAATGHVERLGAVLDAHGFAGRWCARCQYDGRVWGMTEAQLADAYARADVLLNITGGQELLDEHARIPHKVYLETDPVKTEIQVAQGNAEMIAVLDAHTDHFTFGENFGRPDCGVPVVRYDWQPTRQPVALELWPWDDSPGDAYSTVATWDNRGNDIEWAGTLYRWSKRPEFFKLIDLPRRRPGPFEVACGMPAEDRAQFAERGWRCVDSLDVSREPAAYNAYIRGSRGEFTVAKDQNIRLRSGWFSDRSCCYLAAGRPVITQDTGFGNALPTGRGLFAFLTLDDALAALDAIASDPLAHRRAALEIAREFFAADRVVGRLMDRIGGGS